MVGSLSDVAFFEKYPFRRFRARRVFSNEIIGPVSIFVRDIDGNAVEANTVIVGSVGVKSLWLFFFCQDISHLDNDAAIAGFLSAYNLDPTTMRRVQPI